MTTKPPSILAASLFVLALLGTGPTAGAGGVPRNWPLPPAELERRFAEQDFRILEVKGAGGGVTGASRLTIEFPDGQVLKVKWKAVPRPSGDDWNNSPRKELAAYEIQRWIVEPEDFLVPTIAPYCIPLDQYGVIDPRTPATFRHSNCVLGMVAVWLEDVEAPWPFFDEERFGRDPRYARFMADFNVLTYLVDHRDGRRGNLLRSNDDDDPRVYAVDNGIAFSPFPWNFLVPNWSRMRVPWIRKETVERLRKIDDDDLEALGVLAELQTDGVGRLHPATKTANMDEDDGVRVRGTRVQFGLTEEEIEDLEERLEDLLEDVDEGDLAVR